MTHLHERIAPRVDAWRADAYPCDDYPAVAEIFEWARDPEIGTLRFLRPPQLGALETYRHLRLAQETPHVVDLYRTVFPPDKDLPGLLEALGVPDTAFKAANYTWPCLRSLKRRATWLAANMTFQRLMAKQPSLPRSSTCWEKRCS